MIELPEDVDSAFRFIVICSQRAEQLMRGARPRTESDHPRITLVARDEVEGGAVPWRVLTPEEIEAERRARAEEFKADMEESRTEPVPDVLPVSDEEEAAEPAPGEDEPTGDEELARLQKLFGMALEGELSDEEDGAEKEQSDEERAAAAAEADEDSDDEEK